MNLRAFLEKLQNLPDRDKKIIMFSVVGLMAVIMLFFWIRGLSKTISGISSNVQLPQIDFFEGDNSMGPDSIGDLQSLLENVSPNQ